MSDDDNVINLGEAANSATFVTPIAALEDALKEFKKAQPVGGFAGKKLLILAVDDSDGDYCVGFIQAGMKMSECVSLCEVSKAIFLRHMEY